MISLGRELSVASNEDKVIQNNTNYSVEIDFVVTMFSRALFDMNNL